MAHIEAKIIPNVILSVPLKGRRGWYKVGYDLSGHHVPTVGVELILKDAC